MKPASEQSVKIGMTDILLKKILKGIKSNFHISEMNSFVQAQHNDSRVADPVHEVKKSQKPFKCTARDPGSSSGLNMCYNIICIMSVILWIPISNFLEDIFLQFTIRYIQSFL